MAEQQDPLNKGLWTPRSPEDTRALYQDWADSYDADVTGAGYATQGRVAEALAAAGADTAAPVLDFGCGTGLSGEALQAAGFAVIDGTDISAAMLDVAAQKALYRSLWVSEPGAPVPQGYAAIVATGVVSLGAAPPETLDTLIAALPPGGLLAFSYNDATLAAVDYGAALQRAGEHASMVSEAYGPHLSDKEMGSTVYVLRRHG
jgi:predicted TPR repeat methyltransferase